MKRFAHLLACFVAACALVFAMGCSGGTSLADGTYDTTVDTDSNMFHVESCELTVEGGKVTAKIVLPGSGFSRIYFGSAEAAASASDADIYECEVDDNGKYTFTLPVSELDKELQVAAWGQRRDRWYDHTITFDTPSNTTPKAASSDDGNGGTPSASAPAAGEHAVAVELEGGSGKASVESPAKLAVADDGSMTVTLVWSSANYDRMVVDGVEYLPVNAQGNSTFEIPISELGDVEVKAETTAMSEPHMIDYTLHFDAASVK